MGWGWVVRALCLRDKGALVDSGSEGLAPLLAVLASVGGGERDTLLLPLVPAAHTLKPTVVE